MERLERVNSAYDLEYDYYRKNLPAIDDSEDTEESMDLYEKIFDSRESFTILGLDSYIILSKKSLEKIAKMIKKYPQEYVLPNQKMKMKMMSMKMDLKKWKILIKKYLQMFSLYVYGYIYY